VFSGYGWGVGTSRVMSVIPHMITPLSNLKPLLCAAVGVAGWAWALAVLFVALLLGASPCLAFSFGTSAPAPGLPSFIIHHISVPLFLPPLAPSFVSPIPAAYGCGWVGGGLIIVFCPSPVTVSHNPIMSSSALVVCAPCSLWPSSLSSFWRLIVAISCSSYLVVVVVCFRFDVASIAYLGGRVKGSSTR